MLRKIKEELVTKTKLVIETKPTVKVAKAIFGLIDVTPKAENKIKSTEVPNDVPAISSGLMVPNCTNNARIIKIAAGTDATKYTVNRVSCPENARFFSKPGFLTNSLSINYHTFVDMDESTNANPA